MGLKPSFFFVKQLVYYI